MTVLMASGMPWKHKIAFSGLVVVFAIFRAAVLSDFVAKHFFRRWPRLGWTRTFAETHAVQSVLLPGFLGFLLLTSMWTVRGRLPAYRTLLAAGVMGDNYMTPRWIGVAEYLHDHTPPSSKVLALCWYRDGNSHNDYREIPKDEAFARQYRAGRRDPQSFRACLSGARNGRKIQPIVSEPLGRAPMEITLELWQRLEIARSRRC